MEVDASLRVEEERICQSGHIVVALSEAVAVSIDGLTRLFELRYGVAQRVESGGRSRRAVAPYVEAVYVLVVGSLTKSCHKVVEGLHVLLTVEEHAAEVHLYRRGGLHDGAFEVEGEHRMAFHLCGIAAHGAYLAQYREDYYHYHDTEEHKRYPCAHER